MEYYVSVQRQFLPTIMETVLILIVGSNDCRSVTLVMFDVSLAFISYSQSLTLQQDKERVRNLRINPRRWGAKFDSELHSQLMHPALEG